MVTVLFADLVGFTTMSERLDAEDVALVQQAYFAGVRDVVVEHGGQVEKFIGDAVVASFGLPRAGGDDAGDAIGAGLGVLDVVARTEATLALAPGTLRVRVGINTGEVVVVYGGRDPGEWQLTGDVINTAARLQTAAEPGTVLVGPHTAFCAAPAFDLEEVGEIPLKGKESPTRAWRVVRARPVPSREMTGFGVEFVGRERELTALEALHARAHRAATTALLVAPPGAGKSRLVREFRSRTLARGGTVWWANGAAEDGPYGAVKDLLRGALGPLLMSPDRERLLLARLGAETARTRVSVAHTLALLSGGTPIGDPVELWTSWTAMLDAHPGDDAPTWIIEDVHAASADLRAFVRHAGCHVARAGRLVVLTARPSGRADLGDGAFGAVEVVGVEPLDTAERHQLVDELLGSGVVPADVVGLISETSRGNPLFIEELLRSWVQSGALSRGDGGWTFEPHAGRLDVPSTVRSIYLGQLDDLPPGPRGVVESGSVPGITFPSRALPVLGAPDAEGALDFLTGFELLAGPHEHHGDGDAYTYRHALLRDAAYAALPRARRAELHQHFAEWLALRPEPGPVAELVGKHFAMAHAEMPALGREARRAELARHAATWLERAADGSAAVAPQHTAELLQQALQLTATTDDAWGRRQLAFAEALRRSGRLAEAMTAFDAIGPGPYLAAAAVGYEDALFASRLPRDEWGRRGSALLRAALDSVGADRSGEARLLAALARAEVYGGAPERGAATAQHAIDLARAEGDGAATAHALLAVRAAQDGPEHVAERLETSRTLVAAARDAGDLEGEVEGLRLQFVDLLELGDVITADAVQREAEEAITRLGRPLYFWYPPMWRAMRALFSGDLAAAGSLVVYCHSEGARWHYQDVELVHAVQLLQLHSDLGQPELALPIVTEMTILHPERFAGVRAACLARSGQLGAARDQLGALAVPNDQSRSFVLALAAETADAIGDPDRSAELLTALEPWIGKHIVVGSGAVCIGAASHYVGLAARGSGDFARALVHLRDAVDANDAALARTAAARSRFELARTLCAVGRPDEAANVAAEVAVEARRLGLPALVLELSEMSR